MKKHLNLILLGCAVFFAALIFALMAAPGITVSLFGATGKASVYDCLENGGTLAAFIIFIVGFVTAACLLVVEVLKMSIKYEAFVAFFAALLLLVAGILFFCTASIAGGGDLGVGAILCGIFGILSALALCFYGGVKGKFIKL